MEGGREGGRANLKLGLNAVCQANACSTVGCQINAGEAVGTGMARGQGEDSVLPSSEGAGLDGDVLEEGRREGGRGGFA